MAAATAAALTAAAMAAAASNTGLDDSFDSPSLHHLSQFLPNTIVGQRPYIPGSTCSIMPFGSSAISGQQNTISAFATATGATPDRFPDEILQMHSQQLFPSDQSSCSISSDAPGAAAMNRLYSDMCLAELTGGGYLPIATTWDKDRHRQLRRRWGETQKHVSIMAWPRSWRQPSRHSRRRIPPRRSLRR
ncbi:hypothetical protein DL89DRAFT_105651 [Linderina pennispora]|uniref:Uncharacterized protein n=1 Tax=Linderina pennispora TaxID=61395 RepID=A0A1Y1WFK1_9FUNG|nr:uncharacterized protein DL89DRAFT_105651 [Linderina pennispora]ORX72006.1 hypothetical protein DL89DRAFT_105651 [Linderina pennispora]